MIMRKKIKLPLEMADGVKVRTLDELKDNWSLEKVVENYLNGRLVTWLNDRYYTELAEQVSALAEVQDNTALQKELCKIFDVDFADEEDIDVDAVNERNHKLDILRQYTADDTILKNVDSVAFDQEELGDILDAGENIIYLFNNTFSIPLSVKNKKYIGIGKAECLIHSKDVVDFAELGIEFENVVFDEKYRKIEEEESPSKFYNEGCKYFEAKQYQEALECFEKAASKNHAGALFHIGKLHYDGLGLPKDRIKASEYYIKASNLNNADAMNSLADMYYFGEGVDKDRVKALELYQKAFDKGSVDAQVNLGVLYINGDVVKQDTKKGFSMIKNASEAGNALGLRRFADAYQFGIVVEKNFLKAIDLYEKSLDVENSSNAMVNLGQIYSNTNYSNRNIEKAISYYKRASELDNGEAMNKLGRLYEVGELVAQNDKEAVKWYRKGAEAGDANAMNNLGMMYQNGKGVEQSDTEAVKWYRKGAEAGNDWAIFNLGYMYENGRGVAQNDKEAVKWYRKAADAGNDWAKEQLSNLGY